jgi:hypothetical protein
MAFALRVWSHRVCVFVNHILSRSSCVHRRELLKHEDKTLKIVVITGIPRPGRSNEAVALGLRGSRQSGSMRHSSWSTLRITTFRFCTSRYRRVERYSQFRTKAWVSKIAASDACLFVTPMALPADKGLCHDGSE